MRRLLTIFALLSWSAAATAQVAVIAHKSVPADTLSKTRLLDCYTGDAKKWAGGQDITVFDLKPKGKVRKAFYRFLGKRSSRMKSIWLKNMLSGEGSPPEAVESEEALVEKVAATPGSIGFVRKALVDQEVKVLIVIDGEED